MPLTHRKARPLVRDKQALRDDRLFIIACDDTYAPKQYFNFFRIPRVQVHVVETVDGTSVAQAVLDRLLTYEHEEYDERWLLLDTDHCIQGTHLGSGTPSVRARWPHSYPRSCAASPQGWMQFEALPLRSWLRLYVP